MVPGQNLADAGMTLKGSKTPKQQRTIVFVLGGPGSGKGTQVLYSLPLERMKGFVLTDSAVLPQDTMAWSCRFALAAAGAHGRRLLA